MKASSVTDELAGRNPVPTETIEELARSVDTTGLFGAIISTPRHDRKPNGAHGTGPRRRRLRVAVPFVAVWVAASVLIVVGIGSHPTPPPAAGRSHRSGAGRAHRSAVAFLTDAARNAATQPTLPALSPGQYYYEKNTIDTLNLCQERDDGSGQTGLEAGSEDGAGKTFNYADSIVREEWETAVDAGGDEVAPNGPGHFVTPAEEQGWEADGSPSVAGCVGSGSDGMQTYGAPPAGSGGVGDLPTDPTTLGALIAAGRVNDIGQVSPGNGLCPSQAGDAPKIFPAGAVCAVSAQFDIAQNLLVAPEGPQLVGPTLYRILAQLPGVENIGDVTDGLGRMGTAIEDPSTGITFVIDPVTGTLLEQEQLTMAATASPDVPAGTVTQATTFGPLAIVNNLGARPG